MWELIRVDNAGTPWLRLFCQFGLANQPFVFGSWATADWPARRRWTTEDGKPNVQVLRRQYGNYHLSFYMANLYYNRAIRKLRDDRMTRSIVRVGGKENRMK